jgi:hypothetical protein
VATYFAINDDDRGKCTAADASHSLQSESTILGGAAGADLEALFEVVQQHCRTLDVAGCALAHPNGVIGRRLEAEKIVKGCDPEDLALRNTDSLGQLSHRLRRDVAVTALHLLQEGYQAFTVTGWVVVG